MAATAPTPVCSGRLLSPQPAVLPEPPTIARVGQSDGEPAMTLIPNLPATGMVAVAAPQAVGVWSTWTGHTLQLTDRRDGRLARRRLPAPT